MSWIMMQVPKCFSDSVNATASNISTRKIRTTMHLTGRLRCRSRQECVLLWKSTHLAATAPCAGPAAAARS